MGVERLAASLTRLQDALAEVRLPLEVPGAAESRDLIRVQTAQIEDYVLPRLRRLDAPLLAVVGGSTGAGKSTLVNSLVGRVVSEAGVIRPTTRSSVLVHHPDDQRWFSAGQILPGLARSEAAVGDPRVLHLVAEPRLPRGLAVLDAPDVDSVVAENRSLAAQLLGAADLWLFVTSAARYADAVPWQYLRAAARRKAVVAVVLDRVPPAAASEVPPHLGQMMSQRGLSASPLFAIPETEVDHDGLLPPAAVAPISGWLADLAADTVRRNQVVLQTLDGAVEALGQRSPEVIEAIAAQIDALTMLRADAEKSFAEAVRSVAAQTADGTLLRGEVLARWQDFVGTGEFFRAVEKRIGLFRDRLARAVRGEPKKAQDVQLAVESGLEVLIREEGEFAARRVVSAWEAHPAGRQMLGRDGALGRVSSDFGDAAARVIRQWQGDVLEMVATEGSSKKAAARYLALGVNGAGVALMVFVFSQTGGLVGAEVGIAGGTALLAQRLLEAVFGEDAVRRMAKQAKEQLDARVEALMAAELFRFVRLIDEVDVRAEQAEHLRAAVAALEVERVAEDRFVREVPIGELPSVETDLQTADGAEQAPSERFTEDDTGLLPALVSAQLAALAADAARHEDADDEGPDAATPGDQLAPEADEQIILGAADDDPASAGDGTAVMSADSTGAGRQADSAPASVVDMAAEGDAAAPASPGTSADADQTAEPVLEGVPIATAVDGVAASEVGTEAEQDGAGEVEVPAEPSNAGVVAMDGSGEDREVVDGFAVEQSGGALPAAGESEADQRVEATELALTSSVPEGGRPALAASGPGADLDALPSEAAVQALGSDDEVTASGSGVNADDDGADLVAEPGGELSGDEPVSGEPASGGSVSGESSSGAAGVAAPAELLGVEPAERPIPVPAGLAELAAEAVRKPWEPRIDEPAGPGFDEAAADLVAEIVAEPPTDDRPVVGVASEGTVETPMPGEQRAGEERAAVGEVGSNAAAEARADDDPVQAGAAAEQATADAPIGETVTEEVAESLRPAEAGDDVEWASESADASPEQGGSADELASAFAVGDDAPALPPAPALVTAAALAPPVPPVGATDEAVSGADAPEQGAFGHHPGQAASLPGVPMPGEPLSLPAAPVPAPPPLIGTRDPAAVPMFLLVPPDGIPASPPVPRWPDPDDDDPAASAAEEEPS